MRSRKLHLFLLVLFLGMVCFVLQGSDGEIVSNRSVGALPEGSSGEDFDKMMSVLMHPRCINCHPSDNVPKQGITGHDHYFGMRRGEENHGFEATKCNTCHQKENNDFSGVPGAPHWSLAPANMNWEGLTRIEIAESLLDQKRNGGRSHQELVEHLTEDSLVLWAWNPGVDAAGNPREKPPVSEDEFVEAVKKWFASGAVIPKD